MLGFLRTAVLLEMITLCSIARRFILQHGLNSWIVVVDGFFPHRIENKINKIAFWLHLSDFSREMHCLVITYCLMIDLLNFSQATWVVHPLNIWPSESESQRSDGYHRDCWRCNNLTCGPKLWLFVSLREEAAIEFRRTQYYASV